jgi:heterotetrameric sarcosine oxidase gamma subunit
MVDRAHVLAAMAAGSPDCAAAQLVTMPPCSRFILRGCKSTFAAIGIALPDVCRATVSDDRALLWLGPDEYLLLGPGEPSPDAPQFAGVVDVSHRDITLFVSGPRAAEVINAFCALDLHLSAFPVGMCTRTAFAKSEIVLWRTSIDKFRIEVARSFAPYVWACLEAARREFLG